jgi:hypothetical protein
LVHHFKIFVQHGNKYVRHERKNNRYPGKMLITAGKMSVIAAVVQHPRHFFQIIALIADTGPHVQSLRNPNGLPGERIGVQPSEANFPDRFGFPAYGNGGFPFFRKMTDEKQPELLYD